MTKPDNKCPGCDPDCDAWVTCSCDAKNEIAMVDEDWDDMDDEVTQECITREYKNG